MGPRAVPERAPGRLREARRGAQPGDAARDLRGRADRARGRRAARSASAITGTRTDAGLADRPVRLADPPAGARRAADPVARLWPARRLGAALPRRVRGRVDEPRDAAGARGRGPRGRPAAARGGRGGAGRRGGDRARGARPAARRRRRRRRLRLDPVRAGRDARALAGVAAAARGAAVRRPARRQRRRPRGRRSAGRRRGDRAARRPQVAGARGLRPRLGAVARRARRCAGS